MGDPPQIEPIGGAASAKGVNVWRILHKRNQCVWGTPRKGNQYMEAPPHKESICRNPPQRGSICVGSSAKGIKMWGDPPQNESTCGDPPQKGLNIWRLLHTKSQYPTILHKGNQYVQAPPQKGISMSGSSTKEINMWRPLNKRNQ